LTLLAVLGFVAAGCGSGSGNSQIKSVSAVTVAGTSTLSDVKTGTKITCREGGPTLTVPEWPGQIAAVSGPKSRSLRLTRSQAGLVVSCTR
jgi:hypothetical protein